MTTAPIVDQGLEEILIHVDPDLDYHANWTPAPDPPVEIPILTSQIHWGDVFDWVKDSTRHLLPAGNPISTMTPEMVDQRIQTAQGQMMKALSGYINQSAAMTLQLAGLVDAAIMNMQEGALFDHRELSQRIDALQAHNDFVDDYVVPNLDAKITHSTATAYAFALAAQDNAMRDARENIFAPLYTEQLKVQPAIDASAQSVLNRVPEIVKQLVPTLGLAPVAAVTALAAKLAPIATEMEECVKPMCETLGPKTDLGKLLKGLKFAADAALLAELAALDEDKLVALIKSLADRAGGIIGTLENLFFEGGKTLGQTIASAVG